VKGSRRNGHVCVTEQGHKVIKALHKSAGTEIAAENALQPGSSSKAAQIHALILRRVIIVENDVCRDGSMFTGSSNAIL